MGKWGFDAEKMAQIFQEQAHTTAISDIAIITHSNPREFGAMLKEAVKEYKARNIPILAIQTHITEVEAGTTWGAVLILGSNGKGGNI